jgi:hypothetical protein
MQHDQKQLFQIACDYPWYLFTAEEISVLCNVGEHKVRMARNAKDTPFRFNLCRPEWFTGWMLDHPQYQDLKSAPIDLTESVEACAVSVKQTFRSQPARTSKKTGRKRVSAKLLLKAK